MSALTVRHESWPTRGTWTISRGSVTAVDLVVVELRQGTHVGRGECRPYARYDETVESVVAQIEALRDDLNRGLDRAALQARLPAGAARNAVDCALWDLEAKMGGTAVWCLAGLASPEPLTTAYTLSLDSPAVMGAAAKENADRPLLKLKLAGADDLARVAAVRDNAPQARLIVDANEGWSRRDYDDLVPALAALGVELIEQPLPAGDDEQLDGMARPVKLAADESCHDRGSLGALAGRYDVVNIKLDKTGGLTEALALRRAAKAAGFGIMVGCMVATSLAMAPAMLVAQGAGVVDLDGPLVLAEDRPGGLHFRGSVIDPPESALWG